MAPDENDEPFTVHNSCVCYCHRMMDHSIFDRVTRTLILWALLYNGANAYFPPVSLRVHETTMFVHIIECLQFERVFFCPRSISMVLGGLIIADKLEPTKRRYTPSVKEIRSVRVCSNYSENPAKLDLIRCANCIRFLPFYSVQLLW